MNRLKEKYSKEVVPKLVSKHNYETVMLVPKIDKIVINMGVGDALQNSKLLEAAMNDLEQITGLKTGTYITYKKTLTVPEDGYIGFYLEKYCGHFFSLSR